jgi:hypothetical protein
MSTDERHPPMSDGPRENASETASPAVEAGWAWGTEPAPEELVRSFEGAIGAWERHVADCRSCLHQGQWFCPDGESLTRRVASIRAKFRPPREPRRTVSMSIALGRSLTWELRAHLP